MARKTRCYSPQIGDRIEGSIQNFSVQTNDPCRYRVIVDHKVVAAPKTKRGVFNYLLKMQPNRRVCVGLKNSTPLCGKAHIIWERFEPEYTQY